MTNYNKWEKQAKELVEDAEKEDEEGKKQSDEALGLQDGPQGPATQKAKERRAEMGGHSNTRKNFIAEQQSREVSMGHPEGSAETIVITTEMAGGRALRIQNSNDCEYEIPEGVQLLKLFLDRCRNVKIRVSHPLKTSTVEISHCSDVEFKAHCAVATMQCDECNESPVRVIFAEPEHVATFFHQNAPALRVSLGGADLPAFGVAEERQFVSRPLGDPSAGFSTEEVRRGEGDFPINLGTNPTGASAEPESERQPRAEEMRAQGEAKRLEGNDAFKANDFLQAAVIYTEAIRLCPTLHLAWANRAQCFLQTAQPQKALEDATRCTELEPAYAKGWFRKGIACHALHKYGEAIPALAEAEKLDPKNAQIPDSIKMAQLLCRKHGPDGTENRK